MATVYYAPEPLPTPISNIHTVFLGGSNVDRLLPIPHWQKSVIEYFETGFDNLVLLNPTRPWNDTWKKVKINKAFTWELAAIESADTVLMYFHPSTKATISLIETALTATDEGLNGGSKLKIVCPKGYYLKGAVDIICDKYNISQYSSLTDACDSIKADYVRYYQ